MTSEKQHPDAAPRSAAEAADRLRRPSWKDPRLIVGVLLVVVSMAGVVALVGSQDRTAPVYAADRTISVGEPVSAEDLRVVDVRLDDVSGQYLSADREPPADLQFVSVVEEGELVPARASTRSTLWDGRRSRWRSRTLSPVRSSRVGRWTCGPRPPARSARTPVPAWTRWSPGPRSPR
ncbi:SAF domain-containing protein [Nesterenkonia sp. PF2B19]|uniref:SAF domain-containing protein n=1 Tax=Nesterenkonia sp. PF2B19 TaxID=1881858 RepID=UPI000A258B05|nr:hypothetical protein [Nesterenkonia sp. PF2B19]OSM44222.1 hypothetical protein BCY76_003445 [Nesterenkonia sp. PF2B19]